MKDYNINCFKQQYRLLLNLNSDEEKIIEAKKLLLELENIHCNFIKGTKCPYSKLLLNYDNKVEILCYKLIRMVYCNDKEMIRSNDCPYVEIEKDINKLISNVEKKLILNKK